MSDSGYCVDGACRCTVYGAIVETVVDNAARKICIHAPNLGSQCKSICVTPYVCETLGEEGFGICRKSTEDQCLDGKGCTPENEKDKACKRGEILVKDQCKPVAQLGESCDSHQQCQSAFAECKPKKCSCIKGFQAKDNACVAKSVYCPTGQMIKPDTKDYIPCVYSSKRNFTEKFILQKNLPPERSHLAGMVWIAPQDLPPPDRSELTDNCPGGSYCQVAGESEPKENSLGFCCPKFTSSCPVGMKHPTGMCFPLEDQEGTCPSETHYCHHTRVGAFDAPLCCPKNCASGFVFAKRKCYPEANIGEACSISEQCLGRSVACADGVCQCQNGTSYYFDNYCAHHCPDHSTRFIYGFECYKFLKIGDDCSFEKASLCPSFSSCQNDGSAGGARRCMCDKDSFQLTEHECAPWPICPKAGNLDLNQVNPANARSLIRNATFCTFQSLNPPNTSAIKMVEKCKAGEYCSKYISNMGLCCPIQEPWCPDGRKPTEKHCNPRIPGTCDKDHDCHQFLDIASDDGDKQNIGRICCPRTSRSDIETID